MTDVIIRAILEEGAKEDLGPALIVGDLNAEPEDIPALKRALQHSEWHDVGAEAECFGRRAKQDTCHTGAHARSTRRDYIFANTSSWPLIDDFVVDREAEFPTHDVLQLAINPGAAAATVGKQRKIGMLSDMWANQVEKKLGEHEAAKQQQQQQQEMRLPITNFTANIYYDSYPHMCR